MISCLQLISLFLYAQFCLTLCNPLDGKACQSHLSVGFSRQESCLEYSRQYWSWLPFLFQEIFPTQGSTHFWWILYQLSHQGSLHSPRVPPWLATPGDVGRSPLSLAGGGQLRSGYILSIFLSYSTSSKGIGPELWFS